MPQKWAPNVTENEKREQLKLIYDYVKFHIGLYLASPAAITLMADAFDAKKDLQFKIGLSVMILIYLTAGVHAGLFMSRYINQPWQENFLVKFEAEAFSPFRRFMHHGMYWTGLAAGILGLTVAIIVNKRFC